MPLCSNASGPLPPLRYSSYFLARPPPPVALTSAPQVYTSVCTTKMWLCMKYTVISFCLLMTLAAGPMMFLPTTLPVMIHRHVGAQTSDSYITWAPNLFTSSSVLFVHASSASYFRHDTPGYLSWKRALLCHHDSIAPPLPSPFTCFRMPTTTVLHLVKFINSNPFFPMNQSLLFSLPSMTSACCIVIQPFANWLCDYVLTYISFNALHWKNWESYFFCTYIEFKKVNGK